MIGAWFAPNIEKAWKSFWAQPKVLLSDVGQVETRSGPFGDSANHDAGQMHDLRRTHLGSEIILGATDGTST